MRQYPSSSYMVSWPCQQRVCLTLNIVMMSEECASYFTLAKMADAHNLNSGDPLMPKERDRKRKIEEKEKKIRLR